MPIRNCSQAFLLSIAFALVASSVTAQTLNPACVGTSVAGGWPNHFVDASENCFPDGQGGTDGADGVDVGDYNGDGRLDVVTGWEESGDLVVALNPSPATVRTAFQWTFSVLADDQPGLEDAIFVDNDANGSIDYVASAAEGGNNRIFVNPPFSASASLPDDTLGKFYMRARPADIFGNGGCTDLVVGAKDNYTESGTDLTNLGQGDFVEGGIWVYECPTGWAPGQLVSGWSRHRIAGDMKWVMELEIYDMDGDGDLDVLFSDRKKVGWMENPLPSGNPRSASAWKKHIIENAGGSKTGGKETPYRWSHFVDIVGDGYPELVVATNYDFDRGVVGRWFQLLPGSDPLDDYWLSNEIVVDGGIPFFKDKEGSQVSKAVRVADLDDDGRPELVMTARGGEHYIGSTFQGAGVGVYRLSLPDGVDTPPRCGNAPGQTSCTTPGLNQWIWSPIAKSFETMKYDNIGIYDIDGDGDLDITTVEENVDGAGLGTVWFENNLPIRPTDDLFEVPANAGTVTLSVVANDFGGFDPASIQISNQTPYAGVVASTPDGSVDFTPNVALGEHAFSFDYQLCRQDDPAVCDSAHVQIQVSAAVPLLANGGFEAPVVATTQVFDDTGQGLTDWDIFRGIIFYPSQVELGSNAAWQPSAGSQSLKLVGPTYGGVIGQALTILQPTVPHLLRFAQAGQPGDAQSSVSVVAGATGGATYLTQTFDFDASQTTSQNMGWRERATWFQPNAAGPRITFRGDGVIDDVRLVAVPLVSSIDAFDSFVLASNQILDIDLDANGYVTLASGAVDYGTSKVLIAPDPQCGHVEEITNSVYRFVPAPGVEALIPSGACAIVPFELQVEVGNGLPVPLRFEVQLQTVGAFAPVAANDLFEILWADISATNDSVTMNPLANDTDANCAPSGSGPSDARWLCYDASPTLTTAPVAEFADCAFIGAAPQVLQCHDYQGAEPPPGGMAIVSIPYEICDNVLASCDQATMTVHVMGRDPIPPEIGTSPGDLDFGTVAVDQAELLTIWISNAAVSESDLVVSDLTTSANAFQVVYPWPPFIGELPFTLAPGESTNVVVRALRSTVGDKTGTLTIVSNDPDDLTRIPLHATFALPPEIQVTPASLQFGNAQVGTTVQQTVTLFNTVAAGNADLLVSSLKLTGDSAGTFSIDVAPALPLVIPPGGSADVTLGATPGSEAVLIGNLRVSSDDPTGGTVNVPLEVTGATGEISATPYFLQFGEIPSGQLIQRTVTVQNTGVVALDIDDLHLEANGDGTFTLQSPPALPLTLQPGETVAVGIGAQSSLSKDLRARLMIGSPSLTGALRVPLRATTLPITQAAHYGDAHPWTEGWVTTPGDTGADTTALFSDGQFPGVSAFGVHDQDEALRFEVPGPAPSDPWILRSRLRLFDLNKTATNAVQLEVADGTTSWEVQVGTTNSGNTEIELGGATTIVVPAVQSGRSDYVLVEIVRPTGGGSADVFLNGSLAYSGWAGVASANPSRVTFGDGRAALQSVQVSRGRYELVEWQSGAVPACSNGLDDDGDGVIDYAGGDPDCSQADDPSENDPDFDDDGLLDGFELTSGYGFDPTDADQDLDGLVDGQDDFDADGLSNAAEQRAGTHPANPDTDGDGLSDGDELAHSGFGPQQLISNLANGAQAVRTGDVDGDGDLDVFSASQADGEIAYYVNDGSGSFGFQQIISDAALGARSVAVGDIDGDGRLDALSASSDDAKIAWYRQNANGWASERVIAGDALGARSVAVADLDGDGDLDVLATSIDDDTVAWYENLDGASLFSVAKVLTTAADQAYSATAADLDGDGDLDVLVASALDATIDAFRNADGAGSFNNRPDLSNTAAGARAVVAADLDGDGDLDAVSASADDDTIAWYENDGAGNFAAEQVVSTASNGIRALDAADLDGDGDVDLLVGTDANDQIAWYENLGAGSFASKSVISTAQNGPRSVHAADLDGDGDLDALAASNADDEVAWYENLNVANPFDPDTDDDGLLDGFEVANGFDPRAPGEASVDSDFDGLDNAAEQAAGTNPLVADTDGDGYEDGLEIDLGSDPLDAQSVPASAVPTLGIWGLMLLVLSIGSIRTRRRAALD